MDNVDIVQAFERQPDGSWLCLHPATIATPEGTVDAHPGMVYALGERHAGLDVAEYLERLGAQFGS